MRSSKILLIMCALTLFCCLCLMGCSHSELDNTTHNTPDVRDTFEVLELDWAGVLCKNHQKEYHFWETHTYEDPNAEAVMTVRIDGAEYTGTYRESILSCPEIFAKREYRIDGGGYFCVNERGQVRLFSPRNDTSQGKTCTQAECEAIARDFLMKIADINGYQMTSEYLERSEEYEIIFTKYLNGYPTTDFARVYVTKTGQIDGFTSCNLGLIPSTSNVMFDCDKAVDAVYQKLDMLYEDVKQEYDSVVYETPEFKYTLLGDGTLGLYCSVGVKIIKNINDTSSQVSPESVTFIIEM